MQRIVIAGLVFLGACGFAPAGGATGVDAASRDAGAPPDVADAGALGLNAMCDPRRSACADDFTCRPREDGSGTGLCRPPGAGAAGAACMIEGDDCGAGLGCAADPPSPTGWCRPICDVAAPACAAGLACQPWWSDRVGVCR